MALPAQSAKYQNISYQQDYAGQQLPFFIELPIIDQLKVLFTVKVFTMLLGISSVAVINTITLRIYMMG